MTHGPGISIGLGLSRAVNMFQALQPHPEDYLHLRLHRARSVVLTSNELTEIRAAQRTFEGAYMRTAISQFSFALIILRIFTSEFYPIGALFAAYGATIILVAIYRRSEGNRQFFDLEETREGSSPEDGDRDGGGSGGDEEEEEEGRHRSRDRRPPGNGGNGHASSRSSAYARNIRRHSVVIKKFRTSGNSVAMLTVLSLGAYICLTVLIWRLK
ncbi:hypothetical protein QBC33DRAFT_513110 [Phialemonium atrogriseum]|uniref:DUF202 domain-containing protein n=1 Tax=Phialemonium atrogriseum TaxID=1093897 RepID=A0AAJ0C3S6_9PEZI|nr:uncharacterized protein QBC33DRAFT_513110 [Phialemonium atrogriseum]KAK1769614.1 hypothetical protein QBC33DRAFT_513110 [Phialemonium atrogriseum]